MSTDHVPGVRRASVAFVLITLFLDSLGFGLVVPIVPKLVEQLLGGAISAAAYAVGLLPAAPAAPDTSHVDRPHAAPAVASV